jgi:hypothetical protein
LFSTTFELRSFKKEFFPNARPLSKVDFRQKTPANRSFSPTPRPFLLQEGQGPEVNVVLAGTPERNYTLAF